MKPWQKGISALAVIGFLVWLGIFLKKKAAAPGDPTGVGGEGSSNPGLFITFTNPTSYGVGSDAFTKLEFYLSETQDDTGTDNKLTNNIVPLDNIPSGVSLTEGDLSVTGSNNKVKFNKSIIKDLEHNGTYFIGVKVYNNNDKASNIVWSDTGVTYDECRDSEHEQDCWAGGVQGAGGELDYGESE